MDLKILFIEDDTIIRESYVGVLKREFKDVFEACDGLEAYEKYIQYRPDIMIVDVNLPKMSGIEFLKKVRLTDLNTKAILLTSHSDTQTLLEASSLKLTEYLVKPVERKKFQAAIKAAVDELKNFKIYSSRILNLSDEFYWNFHEKALYNLQQVVKLTKTERDILNMIFNNSLNNQSVTSYEELLFAIWGEDDEYSLKSLKTAISGLRKKIPKDTVVNEYGIGYKKG